MACAWLQSVGSDADFVESVGSGLEQAGIAFVSAGAASDGTGGVLVLGEDLGEPHEILRRLRSEGFCRIVVLIAARDAADPRIAWGLRRAGAAEVLAWDDPGTPAAVAARLERWAKVDELVDRAVSELHLVGQSPAWIALLRELVEVAVFTKASIVLVGESGTGKEHLARLVHALDRRPRKGALVTVDCTTIVPELAGSEFFGHERGAFTGALGTRDGAFARADGGTLFLDEVGELPVGLQAQLLRVIQEGTYKRVGGNDWFETRFRLVCATHRDLAREIGENRFRLDFFHRIGGCLFRVPPLGERPEDVLPLACRFISEHLPAGASVRLAPPVQQFLLQRSYAGNVRELKQVVARLCARHVGAGSFTVGDIPEAELGAAASTPDADLVRAAGQAALLGMGLKEIARLTREGAIQRVLLATSQNVQDASKLLKVTDRALQMERAKRGG